MPRALITGISGQDGSYLAEFLIGKGYDVHGTVRPEVIARPSLLPRFMDGLIDRITLHAGRLEQPNELAALLDKLQCDECYHLAGPSTVDSDLLGDPAVFALVVQSTKALLSVVERNNNKCRLFFAGTSEMFGRVDQTPQDERTSFQPRSLYGLARLTGYYVVNQYRSRTRGFACTGILFNHESPRRPPHFLPRKVSLAAVRIKTGVQVRVALGNLDAVRDWGYAPDFVEAMWLMLQQGSPRDFVIATGKTHKVADLVNLAFQAVGLNYREYVDIDPRFYRPAEAIPLCGNSSYIGEITGWRSRKPFDEIVSEMVMHDLAEQMKLDPSGERQIF
jgi:GDPmannose 4,6-dehydratase